MPLVVFHNTTIAAHRQRLEALQQAPGLLPDELERRFLLEMSQYYSLDLALPSRADTLRVLLQRVDRIPPALVLAQAAIESGWGSSRFCQQGNNLFGQRVWSEKIPGLAPQGRAQARFRLAVFPTIGSSIGSYMRNLNTHPAYAGFRAARAALRRKGAVCGDLDIQGVSIGPVGGPGGCGVSDAVRISSVTGVGLSTHAVMDCTTAKSLKRWVETGMKPAVKRRGGGVSELRVVAHYACRTRNSQKGAKLSEHAKGHAIDIAGFTLRDGSEISVLTGWNTKKDGGVLRQMHRSACGPFGTVLGPDANRFHRDHFHFDTARYRSGSYCR